MVDHTNQAVNLLISRNGMAEAKGRRNSLRPVVPPPPAPTPQRLKKLLQDRELHHARAFRFTSDARLGRRSFARSECPWTTRPCIDVGPRVCKREHARCPRFAFTCAVCNGQWSRDIGGPAHVFIGKCSIARREPADFQLFRSSGSLPPFSSSFCMTALCNHIFIAAESSVLPV